MKTKLALCVGAATIAGAVPTIATAHDATVVCNDDDGRYIVKPDFLQFTPTWTFTDTGVNVSWNDGFRRFIPYPGPCVSPRPTTPTTPEVVPPPPAVELPPISVPPPTCVELKRLFPKAGTVRLRNWGCGPTPRKTPTKPHVTNRRIVDRCVVGKRTQHITIVTLSNGKVGRIIKFGKVCRLLPTTG
jgi:hypothetical protein